MSVKQTKEKITSWLSERGFAVFAEPGITFDGAVTASIKMGFELHPARWGEKEKSILADKLSETIGISVQEFFDCLLEEISGKTESEIEALKTRVAQDIEENHLAVVRELQSIKERPFWSLQQFKETDPIAKLLKFKFVGRDSEMSQLWQFLRSKNRFGILVGEGGTGKTRLAIEFADQLDELQDWNVYFKRPYIQCNELPFSGNALFIVEDTVGESYQDNLIHLISDAASGNNIVKLLVVSRPLFRNLITLKLQRMQQDFDTIDVKGGDIVEFLLTNYPGIPLAVARQIESQCQDSFVYAAIYAELFKVTKDVPKLQEVLAQRKSRLIFDVARRVERRPEDVENIIAMIAVLAPVDWENDKKLLKVAMPDRQFSTFEDIFDLVSEEPLEFLYNQDERYFIKPDPIADFITSQFIRGKMFQKMWKRLAIIAPRRLALNLSRSMQFDKRSRDRVSRLLSNVWELLNDADCRSFTPEYFKAVGLLSGLFRNQLSIAITRQNISQWKKCYEVLADGFQHSDVTDSFGGCLLNATYYYGDVFSPGDVEYCLEQLRNLNKMDETAVIRLAEGLVNTIFAYGNANELGQMENCLTELTELCKQRQENNLRPLLAMALRNAAIPYGKSAKFDETQSYLLRLKALCEERKDLRCDRQYSLALREAIAFRKIARGEGSDQVRKEGSDQVGVWLDELARLYSEDPDATNDQYAQALADAVESYDLGNWQKTEQCLTELRKLYRTCPTPPVKYAYVRTLVKTATDGRVIWQPRIERLVELYTLRYYTQQLEFPPPRFFSEIENTIVWEIIKIARDNFRSNKEYLRKSLLRLRDILGDDVEIGLLMMKIEGSSHWQLLAPEIRDYLYKILESGEET